MSDPDRNIVLVSIDSLRADHCGFLGDDRGLTPTMDSLAAAGVSYEAAIAPGPQTFSSMPTVFTGRPRSPTSLEEYPQTSHWERRLAGIRDHLGRYATISERLQERGYETAAVTPNPWTSAASDFDRGFDSFADFSAAESDGITRRIVEHVPGVDTDARPIQLVLNMLSGSEFFSRWESLYEDILSAREELGEPYFLWIFILDTHFPFIPGRAHRREQSLFGTYYSAYRSSEPMRGNAEVMSPRVRDSVARSYRDTVRASDGFLGRLHEEVYDDDPVLVVHSDHGESFGEHGNYGHHHRRVYEENVHVPYFIHNAGVTVDIEGPTSLGTLYDTVLDIAHDGTFDPLHNGSGVDRSDAIAGMDDIVGVGDGEGVAIASSECGTHRCVRGSRFKLIERRDERLLFDLENDPDELSDIATDRPDVVRRLQGVLDRHDRHTTETNRVHRAARAIATNGVV